MEFKKELILQEIAIGKLLGDGSIDKTGNLVFSHSVKQREYIEHCYEMFKNFTKSGIKLNLNRRKDKIHEILYFVTRAVFKDWIPMFYRYDEVNKKRIKVLPNNIEELLTLRALAYWIMDDGAYSSGLIICTHSFTCEEVTILKEILEKKFNLKCKISTQKNPKNVNIVWYIIKIKPESMPLLWELVKIYILPSMKYKFGKYAV